ncbi:uncharacterized protein KIAA1143 homolog [Stomoxys calcitrans]|uniref:uncharacterized protein KIAA1143 homolog n=1 Tax=Stomoxys calcitrans TaxID=35570 RepID=UPI0027E37F63|nr:uncharacterized protein KIAA1143 homolog [Stomoxys calcitrans]
MSKRNIAYIKPQDPSFLAKLKQEIGYKEGPSVETKRQKIEDLDDNFSDSEEPEREDEKPLVVVLKSGDLTEEEAKAEEKRLAKEAAEAPADLNQPIVFRKRHKPSEASEAALKTSSSSSSNSNKAAKSNKEDKRKKADIKNTAKLSFNADEEDEEDE